MTKKKGRLDAGYLVNDPRAAKLVPLITGWQKATKRFSRLLKEEGDATYYYNERASISSLAAGAWLSGFGALEEYSDKKGWGANKKNGRTDLYVDTGKFDLEIEAKQKWIPAGCKESAFLRRVTDGIDRAVADAKKVHNAQARFGCAFYTVHFSRKKFKDYETAAERHVQAELQRFLESEKAHLWAWCFPPHARKLTDKSRASYWPGVVLGLRGVKWWE